MPGMSVPFSPPFPYNWLILLVFLACRLVPARPAVRARLVTPCSPMIGLRFAAALVLYGALADGHGPIAALSLL